MIRVGLLVSSFLFLYAAQAAAVEYSIEEYKDSVFDITVKVKQKSKDKKQTMVLVHGLGTQASKSWDRISNEFAKDYHIVTFDLPGFGKNRELERTARPESYAKFIMGVVSKYAKSKIIYVGHSMGGAIGLRFVSQYPQLVDKAVLMNAAGILEKASYLKFLTRMQKDTKLKSFFAGISNIAMDFAVEVFDKFTSLRILKSIMDKNVDARIALALIETDFTDDIKALKTPTLVIWGGKDLVAPVRTGHMLNYHLANSKLEIIPEGGHVPLVVTPKKVAKITKDWLKDPKSEQITFPELGDKEINCKSKELKEPLTGSYGNLRFRSCSNIILQNLTAKRIQFDHSKARLTNVKIISDEVGLRTEESIVFATNLIIDAPTAILSEGSKLDIAGAIIKYTDVALKGGGNLVYWSTSFQTRGDEETIAVHGKE